MQQQQASEYRKKENSHFQICQKSPDVDDSSAFMPAVDITVIAT